MQYVQPVGGLANDPYVDADPGIGQEGSPVPAAAIEHPMRELVALITDAGLAPSGASLTQVATAIKTIFQMATAVSAAASGTADAITANFTPAIAALSDHLLLIVRAGGANTSTTPTFTPASATIAAKTIVKGHNQALVAGDISGAGFRAELQYDAALDKWVLLNPATGVSVISSIQVGEITFFARNTAPTGYLKANGAAISRSTYADLFAAIGTTYGVGDGATTFNLPDLRGEFLRGWDDSRGIDSGRVFGSAQADELKSHNHTFTAVQDVAGSRYPGGSVGNSQAGTTGSTGGAETRPRNIALLACIKY